jgi:hypothetical protein
MDGVAKRKILPCQESNLGHPASILITVHTELSWLLHHAALFVLVLFCNVSLFWHGSWVRYLSFVYFVYNILAQSYVNGEVLMLFTSVVMNCPV